MPRIEELWAWVTADSGPDDEGVIAMRTDQGWMPMMGADGVRMEALRPIAQMQSNLMDKPVELRRFVSMTVEGSVEPEPIDDPRLAG